MVMVATQIRSCLRAAVLLPIAIALVASGSSAACPLSTSCDADTGLVSPAAPWQPRSVFGLGSSRMTDGSIVVAGGATHGSDGFRDVFRSVDGVTWTLQTAEAPWQGRGNQAMVWLQPSATLVLMGGELASGQTLNDVWASGDAGVTWALVGTAAWSPRRSHVSVAIGDVVLVMGGSAGNDEVWASSDGGATWTAQTLSAPWVGRMYTAAVVMADGSVMLMGGEGAPGLLGDAWRSTDKGVTWEQATGSAAWGPRRYMGAVGLADNSVLLVGGDKGPSGGLQRTMWRSYDLGVSWVPVGGETGWSARIGMGVVAMLDGSVLVMGGGVGTAAEHDVWRVRLTCGKSEPGTCGCMVSDVDSDSDGVADCVDGCPDDETKTSPGECGCGVSDMDSDDDGVVDCPCDASGMWPSQTVSSVPAVWLPHSYPPGACFSVLWWCSQTCRACLCVQLSGGYQVCSSTIPVMEHP